MYSNEKVRPFLLIFKHSEVLFCNEKPEAFIFKKSHLSFAKYKVFYFHSAICARPAEFGGLDGADRIIKTVQIFFLLHIFQWSVMQKTASFLLASYKSFSLVCSLLYGRNIRYYFSPFGHCSKTFKVRSLVHALLKGSKLFTKVGCMMLHSRAVFSLFSFLF